MSQRPTNNSHIEYFMPYTKRIPGRARIHILELEDVNPPLEENDFDGQLQLINRHLDSMKDLRRGDLIGLSPFMGYRNDGTFIFDGQKAIELAEEPDEYGSVPGIFSVPDEFPVRYWLNLITHNNYVPFHPERWSDQLEKNLFTFETSMGGQTLQFPATTIEWKGQKYVIIWENNINLAIWERLFTDKDFLQGLQKASFLRGPSPDEEEDDHLINPFLGEYDRDHILLFGS